MNKDWTRRDSLIFGSATSDSYDIKSFDKMPPALLRQLVDEGFADLEEAQNSAPSIGEFLEATELYPEMTFHGYVVTPRREDYRVSIEGFNAPYNDAIVNDYHGADEFEVYNGWVRAWWD